MVDETAVGAVPRPRDDQSNADVAQGERQDNGGDSSRGDRRRSLSAVVALVSAIAAIGSAVYSYSQVQVSRQQAIANEQQQLLSLVTAIEQEPAQLAQASQTLTGNTLVATDIQYENELAADGEAAASIIQDLHGQGVPGIEYVVVGTALQGGYNNALALQYYHHAAVISREPETIVSALRDEAILRYELGGSNNDRIAHQNMERAITVFQGPYFYSTETEQNSALSYLEDAEYQIPLPNGCAIAHTDLVDAAVQLALLGTHASASAAQRNKTLMSADQASYNLLCGF